MNAPWRTIGGVIFLIIAGIAGIATYFGVRIENSIVCVVSVCVVFGTGYLGYDLVRKKT